MIGASPVAREVPHTSLSGSTAAQSPASSDDPDALYAAREDLTSARRAADIWRTRTQSQPTDFEASWKLARALYWLGGHGPEAGRRKDLEDGIEAAKLAMAAQADRPEGYFWMAANMGALAESFGLRAGIKYRKPVKEALEKVLSLDPAFQQGSADRALGRWYFKVPGLFGGSNEKSVEHLHKSLTFNPQSTSSLYFLAETLLDMNRKAEARDALQQVLDAPLDPQWGPEDKEFKAKAKDLLAKIKT